MIIGGMIIGGAEVVIRQSEWPAKHPAAIHEESETIVWYDCWRAPLQILHRAQKLQVVPLSSVIDFNALPRIVNEATIRCLLRHSKAVKNLSYNTSLYTTFMI